MADQSTRPMRIGCAFTYRAEADTPAVFQVRPRDGRGVRVLDENWSIQPAAAARHYRDLYGYPYLRVMLPAGRSSLCYDALAEVPDAVEDANEDAREVPPDELPDEVLLYTLPSRYILPDGSGEHLDLRPRQPTTQQLSTKPKSRPRGESEHSTPRPC